MDGLLDRIDLDYCKDDEGNEKENSDEVANFIAEVFGDVFKGVMAIGRHRNDDKSHEPEENVADADGDEGGSTSILRG